MPSIRIRNGLSVDILSAESGPGSGISKYFKGNTAAFIAGTELAASLNKSIATLAETGPGLGMSFEQDGQFGNSGVDWRVAASSTVTVEAAQAGASIPGEALFGDRIDVKAGSTFLAVGFTPTLSTEIGAGAGDLRFGFNAGGSVQFRAGRIFDVAAEPPTLGHALGDLVTTGIVPGDVDDLRRMQPGDISSVAGRGQLKVSANFNVAQALNPLATPTLGLSAIGSLKVETGASLSVGASVGISGMYQMRVQKIDATRIRLGVHKMKGSQFQFDVKASAGVSASLGKRELTEKLMGFLGAPKADVVALVDAGLSDEQIDDIKNAIEASLNRSLDLSLSGTFATSNQNTTVFEYEFDLARLDLTGLEALHNALNADLSVLTSRKSTELPAGIKMLSSELEVVREKSTVWKINLLGIVNVLHMSTLVREGKVLFDPESGELLVTDSITAKEILIDARSIAADSEKLRKVIMQSAVLTAAYRAAGMQKFLGLKGSMTYFAQVGNAKPQNIADFLDNVAGMQLITPEEKQEFLSGSFSGRATVLLDVSFDDTAFNAMFRDAEGMPFDQEHYDTIGRECVAGIVQPGDPNDFRRVPMDVHNPRSNDLWKSMTSAGPFNLHTLFDSRLKGGVPLALITADYVTIRWWSKAMSTAAERVLDMRSFLDSSEQDAETLQHNNEFKKKREKLEKSLTGVVKEAQPPFLDAWGVLAMYAAAGRRGEARAIVVTTDKVLVKNRSAERAFHA